MLVSLRAYKLLVSPYLSGSCRFEPSCSSYMTEAVMIRGATAGFFLGLARLLRCHPFARSGYDPVPRT